MPKLKGKCWICHRDFEITYKTIKCQVHSVVTEPGESIQYSSTGLPIIKDNYMLLLLIKSESGEDRFIESPPIRGLMKIKIINSNIEKGLHFIEPIKVEIAFSVFSIRNEIVSIKNPLLIRLLKINDKIDTIESLKRKLGTYFSCLELINYLLLNKVISEPYFDSICGNSYNLKNTKRITFTKIYGYNIPKFERTICPSCFLIIRDFNRYFSAK